MEGTRRTLVIAGPRAARAPRAGRLQAWDDHRRRLAWLHRQTTAYTETLARLAALHAEPRREY